MNHIPPNGPFYRRRRISSLVSLAKALNIPARELSNLACRSDRMYRLASNLPKADGSVRQTWDAYEPLKKIHRSIRRNILDYVTYPSYLTGSLKGCDYKVNASLHAGATIVINEDIMGFFPATSAAVVYGIWRNFFCFGQDVADCLTRLTTRQGELPQGAITSSFLANLAFWNAEPALQASLQARGLVYSRYVDDIAVSSETFLDNSAKTEVIASVYGMLFRHGYRPKRTKHEIRTSGERMDVTKLSVNSKPGLSVSRQSQIRSAVNHLEQAFLRGEITVFDSGPYAQTLGQVHLLARFHPGKAEKLKQRLLALKRMERTDKCP
ncbi:reverse transcriptase family protein [Xenorhabdus szentirmaii]|uniref:Retron reverse transcriptase n=1 Tax=Xenorhabdus szentirmaii DSM 16338 TaxID=1427518 RepID=W1IZU7_9GAMM|nr:reverse transcriptase family protein [Xenorhabdus szentirmaii]PHM33630.1 DNA polymerase [Xenorhabdus szentirmaii DSM 16338]PHM42284.1 DNA polymerase [Xenorhabdus szentirmaii]CDL83151.1 Retron reverse transcriptase [Xenorhabdus szentirmaii DSM 16338]